MEEIDMREVADAVRVLVEGAYLRGVNDERARREPAAAPATQVQGRRSPREEPPPPPVVGEMADAAALPPITQAQARSFRGLVLACAANRPGESATFSQINRLGRTTAANSSVFQELAKLGYVRMAGTFGAPDWRPIAEGEPRLRVITDADGNPIRPWTHEEMEGIKTLRPDGGETYLTYAKRIGRTETATSQRAHTLGCHRRDLESVNAVEGKPDHWPMAPAPAAVVEEVLETGPSTDEEPVDLDDLSKAPREVLLALRVLLLNGKRRASAAEVLELADIVDEGRLASALTRLGELGLVVRDPSGLSELTDAGKRLADLVKEDEG